MIRTKYIRTILFSALQRYKLILLIFSLILFSSCYRYDWSGLQKVVTAIGHEYLRFSVLAINLQGIHEGYGSDTASWEDRYGRIADWMATSGKKPDFIALQEVHGLSGDVKSYDTLFTLITKIKEKTSVSYRIAYLIVRPVPQGLRPTLWAGNALLYNPDRIENNTPISNIVPSNFDDESFLGWRLRKSLPCQDPSSQYQALCSLIDGDGLGWISSYRSPDNNRWYAGPVFARFQLKTAAGSHIHIYNVHVQYDAAVGQPITYLNQFKNLSDGIELNYGSSRLYPPVVLGDFNIGEADILPHFTDFEIAGWSREVMGVLIGKQSKFPSKQQANVVEKLILPEDYEDPTGIYACGHVGLVWSDHCAVFVQFSPISGN